MKRLWHVRFIAQAVLALSCALLLSLGVMQKEPDFFVVGLHNYVYGTAAHPPQYTFPDGGRTLFPRYRLVALYGTPGEPVLGVLGRQATPEQAVATVKGMAKQYQTLLHEHILPTFEIIATIAAADPTDNNDYSSEVDEAVLSAWVATARKEGVYVVLDLQPGRSSFLTQAKLYEPLLLQPNVGLALDPEWRLGPSQVPLVQIGSVGIDEVNSVAVWLASLTATHRLPQKLFLLHEFRTDMLPDRARLDTSHPQLAYAVQMDGQGSQVEKSNTWQGILASPPPNVHFGWKNFTAKDAPMLTPQQTAAITPTPWYISYQ